MNPLQLTQLPRGYSPLLRMCHLFILCLVLTPLSFAKDNLRIVILSDFNGSYGSPSYPSQLHSTLDFIRDVLQPDLLVSAGDVIAGQKNDLPNERFFEMWQSFDVSVAQLLRDANIPYAFAVGNHDGSSTRDSAGNFIFQRERDAAQAYWQQPMYETNLNYQSREDFPFNFSFLFDDVFFAVWDASGATITDEQWLWLETELNQATAENASYRILIGHLPLYGVSVGKNKTGEVLRDGDLVRQRLTSLGINLYISGHHAAYYPAKVGELTLIHSGGIGARQLLNSQLSPVSTVTILELDLFSNQPKHNLETYNVDTFKNINPSTLPQQINGLNGTLFRLD